MPIWNRGYLRSTTFHLFSQNLLTGSSLFPWWSDYTYLCWYFNYKIFWYGLSWPWCFFWFSTANKRRLSEFNWIQHGEYFRVMRPLFKHWDGHLVIKLLILSTASSFMEMLVWMGPRPPSGQSCLQPLPLFPPVPPRAPPTQAVVFDPLRLLDLQFHTSSHWPPPHLLYWVLSTLIPPISLLLYMSDLPWKLEILTLSINCLSKASL